MLRGERGDTEAEKLPAALPPAPPPFGGQTGVGGRGGPQKRRAAIDRVDSSLSRSRSSSSAPSFGKARVCRRMEVVDSAGCQLEEVILLLLRLWFLLSVVGDGGKAGWILFLNDVSGEFSACSMGSWRMVWVHLPACGWVSWPADSSSGVLLVSFLRLMLRCSGTLAAGWFTSMVEDG